MLINIALGFFHILQTTMTMLATAQQVLARLRRLRSAKVLLYQQRLLLPLPSVRR